MTLASGEVVSADVVVGADGNYLQHITRRTVLEGVGEDDDAKPAGWHIYKLSRVAFFRLEQNT